MGDLLSERVAIGSSGCSGGAAITQRRQPVRAAAHRGELVQRGHLVPGADVAGIDLVVGEILVAQHPVLVADQAVLCDLRGVELHLDLHVAGDGQQGRLHLLDQHLARFLQAVDVGVVAVADVGQAFGHRIVIVAVAEAERAQRHPGRALVAHQGFQRLLVADADVEIAVRGQHHPVHATLDERLPRHRVGQLDAGAAVGAAAGLQAVERGQDLAMAVAGGRRQDQPGRSRIHHDRHPVLRAQLRDQLGEGLLEQRQFVGGIHRARGVDQQHQVGGRQGRLGHVVALDADHQQLARGVPGGGREFGGHPERLPAGGRRRMRVVEVVQEFLGTHRVRRRAHALPQHAPHVGVAAGVDVDGERGDRLVAGPVHRVVVAMFVAFGVLDRCESGWRGRHRRDHARGHPRRGDGHRVQRGGFRGGHRGRRGRGRGADGEGRGRVGDRRLGWRGGAAGGERDEDGGGEELALHGCLPWRGRLGERTSLANGVAPQSRSTSRRSSVMSWIAQRTPSRPRPECLTPP